MDLELRRGVHFNLRVRVEILQRAQRLPDVPARLVHRRVATRVNQAGRLIHAPPDPLARLDELLGVEVVLLVLTVLVRRLHVRLVHV